MDDDAIIGPGDWPFDADQHDPLAELRIPVVSSPYPRWKYEVCLVISAEHVGDGPLWGPSLRPDEREVKQILAELDYRLQYYNEGWKAKMRRRPLDVDSSTNTLVLQKYGEGNWRYRRMTWEHGMWPFYDMTQRFTLEALLDHINDFGGTPSEKWAAHKARYPEAFGEAARSAATATEPEG